MKRSRWGAAAALSALMAMSACSHSTAYPEPSDSRPVVDLSYSFSPDLSTVTGTESVTFTPGLSVCELVFRAWPNKPATARAGNDMRITSVTTDETSLPLSEEAAGAPAGHPGTLVSAALPSCTDENDVVSAEVAFTVTVAPGTDERMGKSPDGRMAWLGSAFPMLDWADGVGWQRNPAADVVGEMASTETFELRDLSVTVPQGLQVQAIGNATGTDADEGSGTVTHRFTADAVRDAPLVVGALETVTDTEGEVPVQVTGASGTIDHAAWVSQVREVLSELEGYLGPYPYEHVQVHVLPGVTDGVEFGEAFQIQDGNPADERWLIAHELAHAWFYGLVGNNQGEHPWLDEAFATYAQELVEPTGMAETAPYGVRGALGNPVTWWQGEAQRPRYEETVYSRGGQMLLAARNSAGAEAFDRAVQEYLRSNAHTIATPDDLEASLESVPEALDVLRNAGAL